MLTSKGQNFLASTIIKIYYNDGKDNLTNVYFVNHAVSNDM